MWALHSPALDLLPYVVKKVGDLKYPYNITCCYFLMRC